MPCLDPCEPYQGIYSPVRLPTGSTCIILFYHQNLLFPQSEQTRESMSNPSPPQSSSQPIIMWNCCIYTSILSLLGQQMAEVYVLLFPRTPQWGSTAGAQAVLLFTTHPLLAAFSSQVHGLSIWVFHCFEFVGVTLVNKIIWVLGVQFYNTLSVYCIVCSPPNVQFPFITVYPPFTLYLSGNHTIICVYEIFKKDFIYLFLERGEGRKKGRETVWLPLTWPLLGIWPTTQTCALTGN